MEQVRMAEVEVIVRTVNHLLQQLDNRLRTVEADVKTLKTATGVV